MRAIRLHEGKGADALRWTELPDPTPGSGEVVVRMRAASLNYRDLAIFDGTYGRFPRPFVPLSDGAGDVEAIGPGVRGLVPGDRVILAYVPRWIAGPPRAERVIDRLGGPTDGVLAERIVARAESLVRQPAHLGHEESATLPIAGVTAWRALFVTERLAPGQSVLVQGTGGVASFAIALARAAGARVIVTTRDPAKIERARGLGAEHAILVTEGHDWVDEVRARTRGEGVDQVIDVGGDAGLERSIAAARVGGTVHMIGFLGGRHAEIDVTLAMRQMIALRAASGGSRDDLDALARALEANGLRPAVDRVLPWTELEAALQALRSGAHVGKIVLRIGGVS